MSESERRTLLGVACFLLFTSLVRHGMERRTPEVELPEDPARVGALEARGQEIRDDQEARSRPLAPGERIDLNAASEVELNRLNGVGRATAAAIVQEREAAGPFRSVDDLVRVRGIGPATVARLREQAEIGRAGTRAAAGLPAAGGGSATGARGAQAISGPGSPGAAQPLDLNRASAEELMRLPGVGPAIAGRIVRARVERGGFRTVDELVEVSGIGPATLARLRPLVTVAR
jgi:competence protein ComEA